MHDVCLWGRPWQFYYGSRFIFSNVNAPNDEKKETSKITKQIAKDDGTSGDDWLFVLGKGGITPMKMTKLGPISPAFLCRTDTGAKAGKWEICLDRYYDNKVYQKCEITVHSMHSGHHCHWIMIVCVICLLCISLTFRVPSWLSCLCFVQCQCKYCKCYVTPYRIKE